MGGTLTQPLLHLKLVVQSNLMGDLLLLDDQIQALRDDWVIFIFVFPDLHKDLDHILHSLGYGPFIQHGSETFVNRCIGLWRVLGEVRSNFPHETNSDFDRVICWAFQQQNQDLKSNDLVGDRLVDEVCEEGGC